MVLRGSLRTGPHGIARSAVTVPWTTTESSARARVSGTSLDGPSTTKRLWAASATYLSHCRRHVLTVAPRPSLEVSAWGRVFSTEWQKVRTTSVWVPLFAAPLVAVVIGMAMRGMDQGSAPSGLSWLLVFGGIVHIYAGLFLPLLAGILASLCCLTEHLAGGWKQLLALPVTRTAVYAAKFSYVLLFWRWHRPWCCWACGWMGRWSCTSPRRFRGRSWPGA